MAANHRYRKCEHPGLCLRVECNPDAANTHNADLALNDVKVLQPQRGDQFEVWLKAQRDGCASYPVQYEAADGLLDLYRLHADTGTPLDQGVSDGGPDA